MGREGLLTDNVLAFLIPTTTSQRNQATIHLINSAATNQVGDPEECVVPVKSKKVT